MSQYAQCALSISVNLFAPAGFGKTVSTLLWLDSSGRKTVWIGLDAYDNATSIFYKLFCTGIFSAQPDNKRMESILKDPAFSSSPVEHTINLLAEFTQDGNSYALALDDMHLITNEEILKSLPFIQKRLPHCFVTLILSRNEPPKEVAGLIEDRKAVVITADDLVFSDDEIRKYFGSLGRFLNTNETEAAYAITGGWAIGVNALAKSGQIEIGQGSG